MSNLLMIGILIGFYCFLRILCGITHILIDLLFLGGIGYGLLSLFR